MKKMIKRNPLYHFGLRRSNHMAKKWIQKVTIEYLAGFFDGEGTIAAMRNGWKVSVGVCNTYKPVLEIFKARFGGKIDTVKSLNGNHFKSNKVRYHWRIQTKHGMTFCLKTLLPYLQEKQERALVGLAILELIGDGYGKKQLNLSIEKI